MEILIHTISPDEIEVDNLFSQASLIENGFFSKEQLIKERQQDLLKDYICDSAEPLPEATSANAQELLQLDQLRLLDAYERYEQLLKWLKTLNSHGYNFQIDLPSVN